MLLFLSTMSKTERRAPQDLVRDDRRQSPNVATGDENI